MECDLPDLTEVQNLRIREILRKTNVIDSQTISHEICKVEKSKKNLVLAITPKGQNPIILKLFSSVKSLESEMKIYTMQPHNFFSKSEDPHVVNYAIPQLIHNGKDYIITRLIQGENAMVLFTTHIQDPWNQPLLQQITSDLFQWVIRFSEIYKLVPLDCHLRNFLLHQDTIYGVDFEELGERNEKTLLKVFATLYFSLLGAYPGVIEGLELTKKAKIGIFLLRHILLSPVFQEMPLNHVVTTFLEFVQKEAATVVQRRLNLNRGKGYDTLKIKKSLDTVISIIQSDFD